MNQHDHSTTAIGDSPREFHHKDMWLSGPGAPMWPSGRDVGEFLASLGKSDIDVCTVARAKLAPPTETIRRRTREWLETEDSVIATSLGRQVGPSTREVFDALIDPSYELDAVGEAFAGVETIAEVTVVSLEGTDDVSSLGAFRKSSRIQSIEYSELSQADVDQIFGYLRREIGPQPYEELADELDCIIDADEEPIDLEELFDEADTPAADEPARDQDSSVQSADEVSSIFASATRKSGDSASGDTADGAGDDDAEAESGVDLWLKFSER